MRNKLMLIVFLGLLTSCALTRQSSGEVQEQQVSLEFQEMYWTQGKMMLSYVLQNNSKQEVTIFQPRRVEEYDNFVPAHVPPEFFRLSILPVEALCMTAPLNSGTEHVKTANDLVRIPAGESYVFTLNADHYDCAICDEDATEVQVALRYRFNENYLDREFFDRRMGSKRDMTDEEREELFGMVQQLYRETIIADTVAISL